ncbi:MAG: exo-alpha-sialidase, partial [Rhodothermales bacterium]|nr:exo-alpha-sialidase [Rhodothermales bacterium]
PLDERESGLTVLSDGSLLAHVWATMHTPSSYAAMGEGAYYPATVVDWVEQVQTDAYLSAADQSGGFVLRSTDGGVTWSDPIPGPDTIHGGIELTDGRIMVASYRTTRDYVTLSVADSWKGPWTQAAEIRSPQPDSLRFGEPSIVQLRSGRIVVMMRTTTKPYNDSDERCFLWETFSDDGGRTWQEPFQTPLWGFPPHLISLSDGRVVVAYGHRRPPYGQRVAVSSDGVSWSVDDEIVLRDDAPNKDLGYPASVELPGGKVLTVYYQSHRSDTLRPAEGPPPGRHKPDILASIWTVPEEL